MLNHTIKPSLTLFSTQSPVCKRESLGIGRIYTFEPNALTSPQPVTIEDQYGNLFACGGFTLIQRKQIISLANDLFDQPIVFSHKGLDAEKAPIDPVFLRLVPNVINWKKQQLTRVSA